MKTTDQQRTYAGMAAVGLAVIGLGMQFQTVSLLTGDSVYWYGAGAAVAGVIVALIGETRTWVKWLCVLIALACIYNVITTEQALNQRRQQIEQIFNTPTPTP